MDHNQASLLDHEVVATLLETDLVSGLSWREARRRLDKYGLNRLKRPDSSQAADSAPFGKPPPAPGDGTGGGGDPSAPMPPETRQVFVCKQRLRWLESWASRLWLNVAEFLEQFRSPLIQLLVLCVLISLLIGEYENALSVSLSILIVCLVSYVQRRRASRSLERLTRRLPQRCKAIRDKQLVELETDYLVPGDIVQLQEGQRVPADIRLFDLSTNSLLQVNESNLTGDTQPQVKVGLALGAAKLGRALSGPIVGLQAPPPPPTGGSVQGPSVQSTVLEQQQQHLDRERAGTMDKQQVSMYQNLALMGTLIESGHSKGIVISTGARTRYGEVFSLLKCERHLRSPMEQNIDQLAIHLVVLACCLVACMSIVGILQKRPALEVAYYAISLTVTAIPEGLPVVVAVIMTLGVIRLGERRTIVKSPGNVETLGCIQVLCADKTGTLTRDEMTLTDVVTSELHSLSSQDLEQLHDGSRRRPDGHYHGHNGDDDDDHGQVTFSKLGGRMYSISRLMEVATLCNNATIELVGQPTGPLVHSREHKDKDKAAAAEEEDPKSSEPGEPKQQSGPTGGGGSLQYIGQATEVALLDAAIRLGFGDSRAKFRRLSEIPFSSSSRRMVVQCQRNDGSAAPGPMYYVKGAWEDILRDCSHYYECGLIKPRHEDIWSEFGRICGQLGAQGLRVLALATGERLDQLTFVGVVGIKNALREGIVEAIGKLRRDFHLEVKLITGDSRPTALAVARQLGLIEAPRSDQEGAGAESEAEQRQLAALTMSGKQLHLLLNTDLDQLVKAQEIGAKSVFYRVDPLQKASIVGKLQDAGKIVAMTGDGVNDLISLRRANLSLVMGSGADVCKEIADVILLDNDLGVLLPAVVEGKSIYHKLHCFLGYQISLSLTLILLVAISFGCHWDPPFTVIQLLYINLLADGPLAQSLAMEQLNERELAGSRPRNVRAPLLGCHLLATIVLLSSLLLTLNGGLYYYLLDSTDGADINSSSSGSTSYLDLRSRSLLFSCFISCAIFAAVSLRSRVKTVFETRPHANKQLLYCSLALGLLSVAIVEIPRLNELFDAEWVPYQELLYVFLYGTLVLVLMDVAKMLARGYACLKRVALKAASAKSTIIEHLHLQSQSSTASTSLASTSLNAISLYQQQQQRSMSQLYLATAYGQVNDQHHQSIVNVYDTIKEEEPQLQLQLQLEAQQDPQPPTQTELSQTRAQTQNQTR